MKIDVPYNIDNAEPSHTALSIDLWFLPESFEQAFTTGGSWRRMLIAQATQQYSLLLGIHSKAAETWMTVYDGKPELAPDATFGSLLDGKMAQVGELVDRVRPGGCSLPSRDSNSEGSKGADGVS